MTIENGTSIIIPTYNEAESISCVITDIMRILNGINYEIIVVDDFSTDRTKNNISKFKNDIRLISHNRNKGYGAAIKTGIRNAKFQNILIVDADNSYPVDAMPCIVSMLNEENDMVVGSRKLAFNIRTPARFFIRKLASILTGVDIPDLNSGLRVFKKNIVERFIHLLPEKFSFTSTITIAFLTNGYNVKYIPIKYRERTGKSKIRPIADTLNFIQLVIRMILYFNPLKIFLPISISFIILGSTVLLYRLLSGDRIMNVTTTVLILSGFQIFAIGLLADLINKRLNK